MNDWSAYDSGDAHLDDLLACVLARLQRYVVRHGHRMTQADGHLGQLYVSVKEATRLLGGDAPDPGPGPAERHGWPSETAASERLAQLEDAITRRLEATASQGAPVHLPLEELRGAFQLDETELALLVAAAAPHLCVEIARLYTFAWADFAVKVPLVSFLAELVGNTRADVAELAFRLSADGTLVRRGLLSLRETTRWGSPTPHRFCGVVAADSLVAFLGGRSAPLPASLVLICRHHPVGTAPALDTIACDEAIVLRLRRAVARMSGSGGRLALTAAAGTGRRALLRGAAGELDLGVLECTLRGEFVVEDGFPTRLAALDREATLRRSVLMLRLDDVTQPDHCTTLARALDALRAPFVLTTSSLPAPIARGITDLSIITLPPLGLAAQRDLWVAALGPQSGDITGVEIDSLVSRFDLTPGAIVRAARAVVTQERRTKRRQDPISLADIIRTVRGQIDHVLGELAERLDTTLDWTDAVLPAEVEQSLNEIMESGRNKSKVYDDWGFRRKLSYGRGLSCLFAGPPGTGKTMMAAIVGRTIGVDVYRIDLSRIASKWVGETEKNLARLFDEAERAQVILLFDEADSLFSRRTSVQSANDRFANMEINFLLQRMESYDGMTILTTNFEESIDEAFKRRIRFHVSFPLPDATLRAQLWESMFPPQVPLAEDVAFADLGARFPIAGGAIKNAALRAAFLAASAGAAVGMEHLERAAVAEAETLGLAIRARRLP